MAEKGTKKRSKAPQEGPTRVRLGAELTGEARAAAKRAGLTLAAFIRDAVRRQVGMEGTLTAIEQMEQRVGATLDRMFKDIRRVDRNSQMAFSHQDAFLKLYLTHTPPIPEGPARIAAKASAKDRHEKFRASVAKSFNTRDMDLFAELAEAERNG
jgi:hypothetical protein